MTIGVDISSTINEIYNSRFTNEVSDSIQRLTSGLKINDAADDIGGLVSSTRLNNISSSLRQGIENGNDGLGLIQVSNKAFDNQISILEIIKDKLETAKDESIGESNRESIRVEINSLLQEFDDIASNTNYNDIHTLQKSNEDNDYSTSATIVLDANSNTSITTESIKSNSDGLNLDTLKNISEGNLTNTISSAQYDIVEIAITSIEEYSADFDSKQNAIQIAIENLTNIEKTTNESRENIINTDENNENAILDKFKLLEKSSEFAIVQANITQSRVLNLLSTPINTVDYDNNSTKPTDNNDSEFGFDNTNKTSFDSAFTSNNDNIKVSAPTLSTSATSDIP